MDQLLQVAAGAKHELGSANLRKWLRIANNGDEHLQWQLPELAEDLERLEQRLGDIRRYVANFLSGPCILLF